MSVVERKQHIEADHPQLSIKRQCDLIEGLGDFLEFIEIRPLHNKG